ncbi:MAG TPA: TetR/AcrR family transcriptional regulator [Rhodomicrobium sp.]|nr:TetR/AcrR family transcriptional regulator [Rhodomicrobium sp.]
MVSHFGKRMMPKQATKEQATPRRGAEASEKRRQSQDERRAAILAAALDIFSENGFAAARLEDVAQKAGVAKGTLYLYFPDKEALFEALLQGLVNPVLQRIQALSADQTLPPSVVLGSILTLFQTEIIGTSRERLLRLIIAEGPRFPKIAEFYHREVISKGREIIRTLAARGYERGDLPSDAIARFPQLFFAPLLTAVVWRSLFSRFDPLDVNAMIECHRKLVLGLKDEESQK